MPHIALFTAHRRFPLPIWTIVLPDYTQNREKSDVFPAFHILFRRLYINDHETFYRHTKILHNDQNQQLLCNAALIHDVCVAYHACWACLELPVLDLHSLKRGLHAICRGIHFGLPSNSTHRMAVLGGKFMAFVHGPHMSTELLDIYLGPRPLSPLDILAPPPPPPPPPFA